MVQHTLEHGSPLQKQQLCEADLQGSVSKVGEVKKQKYMFPSKIEWDLTNGPLRKLLEFLDTQV